jgi:hypothetical protein
MQFLLIVEAIAASINSNNVSEMVQLVENLIALGEQIEVSIKNSLEAQPAAPVAPAQPSN